MTELAELDRPAVVSSVEPSLEPVVQEKPWKLVTHFYPDTDALVCLWAADRFVVPEEALREVVFLHTSERLPKEDSEGYEVLYMDTGGGELDQHGMFLKRGSSFELLAKKYGLDSDPGIQPILELTKATDNVEKISLTDVHYLFKGLAHMYRDNRTKEVDWQKVIDFAYISLDILYGQAKERHISAVRYPKEAHEYVLPNGLKISSIWFKPELREEAFRAGNDVVMMIQKHAGAFQVQLQVGRASEVQLCQLIIALRFAEARARDIKIKYKDAARFGICSSIPGWFLHDSGKIITCGTRTHPLEGDEHTKLQPIDILRILRQELAKLNLNR